MAVSFHDGLDTGTGTTLTVLGEQLHVLQVVVLELRTLAFKEAHRLLEADLVDVLPIVDPLQR